MKRSGALLALALTACGAPPAQYDRVRPTIVSLNPCTDAILARMVGPEQLLAISHYSHDPRASSMPLEWAREYPATGGSVEEVLALDPDIVVASAFLPPATKQAFERLGIRVETFGIATTFEENEEQVHRLAALTGDPDAGAVLAMETDTWLDETRWDGPKADALLWQEGGIVPGDQTLIAALLDHTGFVSHSAARGLGQASYVPLEEVLADPPQVIITAGSERMLHHPVLRELEGTRYEQLDPALLFCGGPSVQRAAKRLAEIRERIG